MSPRRVALLLPPSKGKADDVGGDMGITYGATLQSNHPLNAPRKRVLDALMASTTTLDSRAKRRLYGVNDAGLVAADQQAKMLSDAPTKPARDRYRGVVYTQAGLDDRSQDHPDVTVFIVSALLGLVELDTPVPNYRLEFGARLPPVGALARYWADACGAYLCDALAGYEVWNLLPQEHRGILSGCGDHLPLIDVSYVTPFGTRANTARIKGLKGQLVAAFRREGPQDAATFVAKQLPIPGWTFTTTNAGLIATCHL